MKLLIAIFNSSNFNNNLQPVLPLDRFSNATTNIFYKYFARMTTEGNIHSRAIQK